MSNIPSPDKMTMKKAIFVYVIFAFLLTSFAGCGKLKDSLVSGLNQPETSNSPEVVNQSETPPAPPKDNNQSETPAPPKDNSQPETPTLSKANNQPEASSNFDAKDLMKKESWKEWTCRQWKYNKRKWISCILIVASGIVVAGVDCYNRRLDLSPNDYQGNLGAEKKELHKDIPADIPRMRGTFIMFSPFVNTLPPEFVDPYPNRPSFVNRPPLVDNREVRNWKTCWYWY